MKLKRKTILLLVVLSLLCVSLIVGVSYSIYQLDQKQTTPNVIQVGCFTIEFEDYGTDSSTYTNLSLTNSYPISTNTALNETPYKFKITNTCDYIAKTNIAVNVLKTSSVSQLATTQGKSIGDMIDISIKEGNNNASTPVLLSSLNEGIIRTGDTETDVSYIIRTEYLEKDESKTYSLWMWVPESINGTEVGNEAQGLTLYSIIDVYSLAVDDEKIIYEDNAMVHLKNAESSILDNFTITGGTENSSNVGEDGTFDLVVNGKNLLNENLRYYNNNGVTLTDNNDGTYILQGTINSNVSTFHFNEIEVPSKKIYIGYSYCALSFNIRHETSPNIGIRYGNIGEYELTGIASEITYKDSNRGTNGKAWVRKYIVDEGFSKVNVYLQYISVNQPTYVNETWCPQLEVCNEYNSYEDYIASNPTFEPYKEKRYTIELKDTNNNIINGLSSSDTLKKVNGVWVIDNGITQTELASSTQGVLNNIELYDGVNNIWVDDDVLITHITVDYYEN